MIPSFGFSSSVSSTPESVSVIPRNTQSVIPMLVATINSAENFSVPSAHRLTPEVRSHLVAQGLLGATGRERDSGSVQQQYSLTRGSVINPTSGSIMPMANLYLENNVSRIYKSQGCLSVAIKSWLPEERLNSTLIYHSPESKVINYWQELEKKPCASYFANFLDRMNTSYSAGKQSKISVDICQLLERMVNSEVLAQKLFEISYEREGMCIDRALLILSWMQQAVIKHDINDGYYDNSHKDLILMARENFRLNQLNNIVAEYIIKLSQQPYSNGKGVDEVEIYLGFQVKLREALNLTSAAKEVCFPGLAPINNNALKQTEISIKQSENREFPAWLASWKPMKAFLHRLSPDRCQSAEKERYKRIEGELDERIKVFLEEKHLENIPDARVEAGKIVMDEINSEIDLNLMFDVLSSPAQIRMIREPIWKIDSDLNSV